MLFWILVIAFIFWVMLIKNKHPQRKAASVLQPEQVATDDNATSYRPIPLLTNYERLNYMKLREYAYQHDLIICPKIRLADLIEPKPNEIHAVWQKHFNMICSKHVDFTLCDRDMNVKVIIELDDKSHQRQDRQIRDRFVDTVLRNSGYKIIHIPAFNNQAVAEIDDILNVQITQTKQ